MSSIVQHAPRFEPAEAVRIAQELFGLDVSAQPLPSERDQNFRLTTGSGEAYVLKVANATERVEVLEFQNEAMMHIARRRASLGCTTALCSEVCPSLGGETIATVARTDGATHFVRLLTYLPGKPLAKVKPHDADLLFSLGRFLGEIDLLLEDFDHPGTHRDFHWDLKNAGRVVDRYSDLIEGPDKRGRVQRLRERFQAEIAPQLPALRTRVIHNDGN
ncbi:MAG: phosphotransferase, partial [Desulfobacterales bacterium]